MSNRGAIEIKKYLWDYYLLKNIFKKRMDTS